ncbi:unnamed protein product [Phytomonas sp. EM1]|nr:unnamed protein product [Phytomonas sp. EM1]|eukprot:CCW60051.1 unnamed protein product [Phytomonas sp. isolate EM1]
MSSTNHDHYKRINAICIDVNKMLSHYGDAQEIDAEPMKSSSRAKRFTPHYQGKLRSTKVSSPRTLLAGVPTKGVTADDASTKSGCCFWSMGTMNSLPPLSPADPLILDSILRCDVNDEDKKSSVSSSSHRVEEYRVSCSFSKPKSEFVVTVPSQLGSTRRKPQRLSPDASSRQKSSAGGRYFDTESRSGGFFSRNRAMPSTSLIVSSDNKGMVKKGSSRASLHSPAFVSDSAPHAPVSSISGSSKFSEEVILDASSHPAAAEASKDIMYGSGTTLTRSSAHHDTKEHRASLQQPVMAMHAAVSRLATHLVTSYHPSSFGSEPPHWGLPISTAKLAYPNSRYLGRSQLLRTQNLSTKGATDFDKIGKAHNSRKIISGKDPSDPQTFLPITGHRSGKHRVVPGPWKRNCVAPLINTRRPKKR